MFCSDWDADVVQFDTICSRLARCHDVLENGYVFTADLFPDWYNRTIRCLRVEQQPRNSNELEVNRETRSNAPATKSVQFRHHIVLESLFKDFQSRGRNTSIIYKLKSKKAVRWKGLRPLD
jgi:hypothetical protein